jgi:hypothetical protein
MFVVILAMAMAIATAGGAIIMAIANLGHHDHRPLPRSHLLAVVFLGLLSVLSPASINSFFPLFLLHPSDSFV